MDRRVRFIVQGQVQGVGFRPFVFTLAEEHGLTGFVRNSPRGVVIEAQGARDRLSAFARDLEARLPPLARITALVREDAELAHGEDSFIISPSTAGSTHAVLVSPDIATCSDCLADIAEPGNRRHGYPFTNCTNCGPRYSITRSIPYDRASTSMACFPLCPECEAEYGNPRNRRFHAQPNACPVCGPELALLLPKGSTLLPSHRSGAGASFFRQFLEEAASDKDILYGGEVLEALADFLLGGGIAAIKGLGGFHLACDARDAEAVALLRSRKHRPHKPFAVMAADPDSARGFAVIGEEEEALLASPERPIVICDMLPGMLAPGISPDTGSVGLMLPYTPLHALLFRYLRAKSPASRPPALVMTSGNPGGEPICLGNREAVEHLSGMADAFLLHNRDILIRVDDSVLRPMPGGAPLFYRRARGYVPRPVTLGGTAGGSGEAQDCVLGVGAELKNTLCLSKGGDAFVSQHIGDMSNLETAAFHAEIREHLASLLKVGPRAVVCDLHPDYLSTRMAEELSKELDLPLLRLQHHFAHAHAVLAEHAFSGKALVLALDGTGFGDDGALWGGEALLVDTSAESVKKNGSPLHKRLASFAPMDLPGGEAAIREPWRIAHSLLLRLNLLKDTEGGAALPWLPEQAEAARLLPAMLERRINCPVSTSAGRLFDAVSALLGLCCVTTYEGQAAIRLEEAQAEDDSGPLYPCPFLAADNGMLRLDSHSLFSAVYHDLAGGSGVPAIARRFHRSLVAGLVGLCAHLAAEWEVRHIGLSGGCLQNMILAAGLAQGLEEKGLIPLMHKALPPNDACISLGQVAYGRLVLRDI